MKQKQGLTLLEFLITLSLSLFLMGLILKIYISANYSFLLQTSLQHIQQNAKSSISALNIAIREAGNMGCMQLTDTFPNLQYRQYSFNLKNRLSASNNNDLIIWYTKFPPLILNKPIQNHQIIFTNVSQKIKSGNILVISDCKHAELFKVQSVHTLKEDQKITSESIFHYEYGKEAEITGLEFVRFFVKKSSYNNLDGSPIYALFKEDKMKNSTTELVEYVNSIQITFVISRNHQLIELKADEINDWSQVKAISISLELVYPPLKKIWHDYISLTGN